MYQGWVPVTGPDLGRTGRGNGEGREGRNEEVHFSGFQAPKPEVKAGNLYLLMTDRAALPASREIGPCREQVAWKPHNLDGVQGVRGTSIVEGEVVVHRPGIPAWSDRYPSVGIRALALQIGPKRQQKT